MNKTQILGLAIIGLSLFIYIGGAAGLVGSWLASVDPNGVHIYVLDADTRQNIPTSAVSVQITGFSYIGTDYPLSVVLKPSSGTPAFWSFSSSLFTTYYVSVSADGYVTKPGTVSMPQNFIQKYTWVLSVVPAEDPVEYPVEDPVEDPVEGPVEDPVVTDPEADTDLNQDVETSLRDTLQTYSLFTGVLGAGVFALGCVKEEKRR